MVEDENCEINFMDQQVDLHIQEQLIKTQDY